MHRIRFTSIALSGLFLVIAGCGGQRSPVAPEEVLARSALASQQLASARYTLLGTMRVSSAEGGATVRLKAEGVLGPSGRELQVLLKIAADVQPEAQDPFTVNGEMEVIVLEEGKTYLNMHALTLDPDPGLFAGGTLERFLQQWWKIPNANISADSQSIAADPSFVRAQSQIVRVTHDLGIQQFQSKEVHHYRVTIDRDKLLTYLRDTSLQQGTAATDAELQAFADNLKASGELRIDTETYLVQWVSWQVEPMEVEAGTISGSFEITLEDHNTSQPILPPQNAQQFSPYLFFQDPTFMPSVGQPELPPGVDEEILRQILEAQGASTSFAP